MNKRLPIRTPAGNIWLDVKAIAAKRKLPLDLFRTVEKAEVTLEQHVGELLLEVKLRIAGKVIDEKEHYFPTDWWDAFRARWFKTALLRRIFGAPKWTRITMRAEANYPTIQVPNHKPFVQVTLKKETTKRDV